MSDLASLEFVDIFEGSASIFILDIEYVSIEEKRTITNYINTNFCAICDHLNANHDVMIDEVGG